MTRLTLLLALSLFAVAVVAPAPLVEAEPDLPPEYIGGYCGWHWHDPDLKEGDLGGYHYHHCI